MEKKIKVKTSNDKTATSNQGFIKSHPIVTYYILVFAISWGCILAVIGPGRFIGTSQMSEAQQPFVYLATLAGPSIAGILSASLVYGRVGLKDIRSRLFKWRVGIRWYMMALLTAPILMTGILIALSLTPAIVSSTDKPALLVSGIVAGLVVGFFEELGWSGFAIPQLRKSYGFLATGLIMGLLWGAWHFPLFSSSASASGDVPPVLYLAVLLFSWLPAYRVLMVWVYDYTNSVLLMILMHVPIVVGQFVLLPTVISGWSIVIFDLILASALWVMVAIVVIRRQLVASNAVKKRSI